MRILWLAIAFFVTSIGSLEAGLSTMSSYELLNSARNDKFNIIVDPSDPQPNPLIEDPEI